MRKRVINHTCVSPIKRKGRALLMVLSFSILGVMLGEFNSYAYTVDDLREFAGEFTGGGRINTLENKAKLGKIIYEYGVQKDNQEIINIINSNDIMGEMIERMAGLSEELEACNKEIRLRLHNEDALKVLEKYREAENISSRLKRYNISGIKVNKEDEITDEEYGKALIELEKTNEVYELGDIGKELGVNFGVKDMKLEMPFGDNIDINNEIRHSNGVYIKVEDAGGFIKNLWNGVVEKRENTEEWGEYIVVRHGNNLTSSISFLHDITVNVGDEISQYDIVGKCGEEPIYIEIILDGEYIDPLVIFGKDVYESYFNWKINNPGSEVDSKEYNLIKNDVAPELEELYKEEDTSDENSITVTHMN